MEIIIHYQLSIINYFVFLRLVFLPPKLEEYEFH